MMKDYVIDALISIGIPAGIKGFSYICDAMELFSTDPYYPDGKISVLYIDIAKKYHTTPSRVERSIRHAFDIALTKGDPDMVAHYLDLTNRQNSTQLRTLYLRIGNDGDIRQNAAISNATHRLVLHRLVNLKHRSIWKQ